MAETKIQWTASTMPDGTVVQGFTFNPWRGCTKVSEGCQHCYAERQAGRNPRVLGVWGPGGRRAPAAESYWNGPVRWNREAAAAGGRVRVFCASIADVFEGSETMPAADVPVVEAARRRLWDVIATTPSLDWILITKRPQNILTMVPNGWATGGFPPHVWVGTSVETQARADERLPHLVRVPARVRCVSAEPLLEAVDLRPWLPDLHWVKVGGESGGGAARPFDPNWARGLLDQCRDAGVAYFFKQLGDSPAGGLISLGRKDPKGGDLSDIPEDLRIREFPVVA